MVEKREEVSIRLAQIQRSVFYDDRFGGIRNILNPFAKSRRQTKPNPPSIKKPHQPIKRLWGFYSLLLTRLLSHSVKIGHIPIYIGIKFDFVLCESIVRWTLSAHNDLRNKEDALCKKT